MSISLVWFITLVSMLAICRPTVALNLLDALRGAVTFGDGTVPYQTSEDTVEFFVSENVADSDLPLDERVSKKAETITEPITREYLVKYGYMEENESDMLPHLLFFQEEMGIPQSGVLDMETRKQIAYPRCDVPDYTPHQSNRKKRFSVGNSRWTDADMPLTVGFVRHTPKMSKREQEQAFMDAANTWAAESGLSFVKGNRQNSKIRIDFKHHDGPWGVLGKAWFPRVGKIEFENGENWINKLDPRNSKGQGLAFFSVAMHELGHALGISHSNVRNSIMHAQYQRDVLGLTNDDIKAISKLYGPARRGNNQQNRNKNNTTIRNKTTNRNNNNNRTNNTSRTNTTSRNNTNKNRVNSRRAPAKRRLSTNAQGRNNKRARNLLLPTNWSG